MNHKLSHLIGLIDKLPDDQAKILLGRLMKEDPIIGFKLLTRQYGFADLRFANREGLAALFESVSLDVVVCALNGSSDALVRKFTQHLSTTDMTSFVDRLYSHRASDEAVRNAQRKILVKAFMLQRKGQLIVKRPGID
ncbi:MAG: FliG C-terminal domain-containing protein [Bradymonadia bacterium]